METVNRSNPEHKPEPTGWSVQELEERRIGQLLGDALTRLVTPSALVKATEESR